MVWFLGCKIADALQRFFALARLNLAHFIHHHTVQTTTQISQNAGERRKVRGGSPWGSGCQPELTEGIGYIDIWLGMVWQPIGARVLPQPAQYGAAELLIDQIPGAFIALADGAPKKFKTIAIIRRRMLAIEHLLTGTTLGKLGRIPGG